MPTSDSTGCPTPGDCQPSCSDECFKAKLQHIQYAITRLKKARK